MANTKIFNNFGSCSTIPKSPIVNAKKVLRTSNFICPAKLYFSGPKLAFFLAILKLSGYKASVFKFLIDHWYFAKKRTVGAPVNRTLKPQPPNFTNNLGGWLLTKLFNGADFKVRPFVGKVQVYFIGISGKMKL